MIAGEYGKRLILTTAYDISGNVGDTGLAIEVVKPDGIAVTFDKATGVILGSTADTVTDEKGRQYALTANHYLYRDWLDGDIDQPGTYRVRAVYTDASKELRSRQASFLVEP